MIDIYSEAIDNALSMRDIVEAYAPEKGAGRYKNRIPCPFHGGEHDNLSYSSKTWYCFVCGEKGNIISFVQRLFGLDRRQAISKINDDFNLHIQIGKKLSLREKAEIYNRQRERERRRDEEKRRREETFEQWLNLLDEAYFVRETMREYKPQKGDTTLHPLFVDALMKKDYIKYKIYDFDWGEKNIK